MSSRKMTLDLHPVCNQGRAIEQALHEAMDEAEARKVKELEIITGKGSGARGGVLVRTSGRRPAR